MLLLLPCRRPSCRQLTRAYSPTHGSPTNASQYCLFPAHHMDRAVVITVVILFFLPFFPFFPLCLFAFLPVIPCIFSLPILPLLISCISIFFHFFFFLSVAETYHTSRASFLFLFPEAKHSIKMMRSGRRGFFAMKTWIPIHSPLSIRSGRIHMSSQPGLPATVEHRQAHPDGWCGEHPCCSSAQQARLALLLADRTR